jgi:phosphatidate cytidylyltransferase
VTRVLSAAALIALLIATVWFLPAAATVVVASAVAVLASVELAGLSRQLAAPVSAAFVGSAGGAICAAFAITSATLAGDETVVTAVLVALVVGSGAMTLAAGPPSPSALTRAAVGVMAPIYVGLPLGIIARLRIEHGPYAVGLLAVVLIGSDSAQYFVGRITGRHKLAPAVSPAKTIEGAIGGLVAAGLVGATLGVRWVAGLTMASALGLGLALAVLGMLGDLFESLLKRSAGVKDSSSLIPGHGGMLDRIDSWLFAAPAYYLLLRFVG